MLKCLPLEIGDFKPQRWICHHDLTCRKTDKADVVASDNSLAIPVLQDCAVHGVYDL